MNQSPMFKHAGESFEHGLEHYLDGTEKSRKFALLHIDQAIELLLKEKAVQLGKSIYKSDGTTLNIHEVFKSLKDVSIPERPRLEELHDLRNTVQHKGLTPDKNSTQFYVQLAYSFVKRFLQEELEASIDSILSQDIHMLMETQPLQKEDSEQILAAYETAQNSETPSQRIMSGYTALNLAVNMLSVSLDGKIQIRRTLRNAASKSGYTYDELKPYLKTIMMVRHQVVHSDYQPTDDDASQFLEAVRRVLEMVGCVF